MQKQVDCFADCNELVPSMALDYYGNLMMYLAGYHRSGVCLEVNPPELEVNKRDVSRNWKSKRTFTLWWAYPDELQNSFSDE